MIQELREYSQSFLFKLLLGVICVTFVVSFGVGSFGDRKEVIAKVNGREILLKDYRKAYQNRLQSLRQQFGENADAFAEQINLRQRVFEHTYMLRAGLLVRRKRMGMSTIKSILLGISLLVVTGCTGKYSPFTDENHFDTVFGYPPKAIAKFLDIEDQLTVDPDDLNKERPRY